jgi:secreted Zn-dependent insulinase-like peptidase
MQTLKHTPAAAGIDVRSEMLAHYARFYSANIMTLAVLGRESLDELEAMITGAAAPPPAPAAAAAAAAADADDDEAVWRWRFKRRWSTATRRAALGLTASDGPVGGGLADAVAADDESRPPTRAGSGVLPSWPGEEW